MAHIEFHMRQNLHCPPIIKRERSITDLKTYYKKIVGLIIVVFIQYKWPHVEPTHSPITSFKMEHTDMPKENIEIYELV